MIPKHDQSTMMKENIFSLVFFCFFPNLPFFFPLLIARSLEECSGSPICSGFQFCKFYSSGAGCRESLPWKKNYKFRV